MKKKKRKNSLQLQQYTNYVLTLFATAMIVFGSACNEPSVLGGEFVDDSSLLLVITDSFSYKVKTVVREAPIMYSDRETFVNTNLLGNIDDPIYGKSSSQIFSQLNFGARVVNPFAEGVIDSIRLVLKYDTFGIYGTLDEEVRLEVFELDEELKRADEYRSSGTTAITGTAIVDTSFYPAPYDSLINKLDTSGNSKLSPRLVLPVDKSFADRFIALDSAYWQDPDSFYQVVKGINIKLTSNNTMLGFDLDDNSVSKLVVYYNLGDTTFREFSFSMDEGSVKYANYTHDYQGTLVGDMLNDSMSNVSDTLCFLQEMQGLNPVITISNLDWLEGNVINSAILEIAVADLLNDDKELYPEVLVLTAEKSQGDTLYVPTRDTRAAQDLASASLSLNRYLDAFGGSLEKKEVNGDTINVYRLNITSEIQSIVSAGENEKMFIINSFFRPESPRRVSFYGNNTNFPVNLKVIYTDL